MCSNCAGDYENPALGPLRLALYPEFGGPPLAYHCCICLSVFRTRRGIEMHLIRVHELTEQRSLFDAARENNEEVLGVRQGDRE